jgi:hypothetical protein
VIRGILLGAALGLLTAVFFALTTVRIELFVDDPTISAPSPKRHNTLAPNAAL